MESSGKGLLGHWTTYGQVLLGICAFNAVAELTVKPRDTEAVVSQQTVIHCSTTDLVLEIHWYHYPFGTTERKYVYGFGAFHPPYTGRFHLDRNNLTGVFDLVIDQVEPGDAGIYECKDENGQGTKAQGELVVLETGPTCQFNMSMNQVIGNNSCGIEPDNLELSCSVAYSGNIPPVLEWLKVGDSNPITKNLVHRQVANQVYYSMTVKGDINVDGASYTCQTTRAASQQRSCTSDIINVLYAFNNFSLTSRPLGEEVYCVAKTSAVCKYRWTVLEESSEVFLSTDQKLKLKTSGLHKCEANCLLRSKSCNVVAMLVYSTDNTSQVMVAAAQADAETHKAAFIAVLVILLIIFITLLVLCFCCFQQWRKNKHSAAVKRADWLLIGNQNEERIQSLEQQLRQEREKYNDDKGQDSVRIEELEKLLEQAQRQWAREKEILVRRIDESKKGPVFMEYSTNPILMRTIKTRVAESEDRSIKGLALLNNELFVISQKVSEVEVYNTTTLELLRRWELKDIADAVDATACSRNSCLYICDSKDSSNEILRVDPDGLLIIKWDTGYESGRLSVTNQANIIVADFENSKLNEFSPNGELLHEIDLSKAGVLHPMHALKLTNGHFIVTHGFTKDPLHRVCEVGTDGNIVRSFGEEKGSSNRQLSNPTYLALDRDGSIMVIDAGNSRVLLLGSDLRYKREIVSQKDGIQVPMRISLDEVNGRLHVAEYKRGSRSLLIFGIK